MSLTKCTSIVQRMDQADQDALLNRLDNYQAVGMTPKQAQLAAAQETLKQVESEGIQQSARELIETPQFKAWFGDWKALAVQNKLDVMKPLKVNVPASWRGKSVPEMRELMAAELDALVKSKAVIEHPELGPIRVGRKGAQKSESASRDPAKILTVADLRNTLPAAMVSDYSPSDEQGVDGYTKLLLPIDVDGLELVAVFAVRHQTDGQWYYNTVTVADKEKSPGSYESSGAENRPLEQTPITGLDSFIRQKLKRVNPESVSKVVDDEGRPLVVYHGTTYTGPDGGGLDRFKENTGWFTAHPAEANTYGGLSGEGANIVPVFLSIKNPRILDQRTATNGSVRDAVDALQGDEDGVLVMEGGEIRWAVVANPTQIKSAIGNNGDFDGTNPDISKSARDLLKAVWKVDDANAGNRPTWYSSLKSLFTKQETVDQMKARVIGKENERAMQLAKFNAWRGAQDLAIHGQLEPMTREDYELQGRLRRVKLGEYVKPPIIDKLKAAGYVDKRGLTTAGKDKFSELNRRDRQDAARFVYNSVSKSARSPLGFYSALAEGIESIATKQQPAGGWLAQIKGLVNKGAVKQDEVEWSGLADWLTLQEGKITKQQIADFLDANGVQVQETVLGEPEKSFDIYREGRGVWKGAYIMSYGTREDAQAWVDDHADEGDFVIEEQDDADSPTGTKYEQYSLPGGENYREVLLTLPEKTGTPLREALEAKYGKFGKSLWNTATPEERAIVDKEASGMKVAGQKGYVSSHWDQQNILAHLRVDDRTDADGASVLMIQELQSDWGQDGKKKGFIADPTRDELRAQYAQFKGPNDKPFDELDDAYLAMVAKVGKKGSIPAAPFVTKTDGWLNLALKRAIIMAVEGGYQKIAFVNGEQSADRYSLAKQIEGISVNEKKNGDWELLVTDKGGRKHGVPNVPTEQLQEHVGKDIANEIINNGKRDFTNLDLKVGGEGMKKFYDAIVPNAAKALLKKLGGGQMETVNILGEKTYTESSDMQSLVTGHQQYAQPGFDITPAMREKVGAGLPLFSKRDTQAAEAAGFDTETVWFHGTTAKDFKAFRQGKGGINELGEGIYFTSKPLYAEAWMGRLGMGGRIIPAYLKKGDIFDLGAKRDLLALAKRIKAMNPVTDGERQARQIRADKSVTEWTPEEQRIVNDASMDLWRTWLLEPDADLAKQIERGGLNAWLARAGYVGAKNDNSQIPGQVVVFDAKNIRSPWAKFNPKKVDSANILHSQRGSPEIQDTPEFKTWSQGLDLVEAGEEYAGGPAVFTVYHGTTHSDITQFERVGQSEGFLGKGPYFTTDPEDASENYAGIGPDLTGRIEREKENIYDNDDPQSQADLLRDYFETEPGELAFYIKANQPGFDAESWQDDSDAIGLLWERFAEPAASLAATRAIKGDTDGLMMKAYVRLSNPADTTGNSAPLMYEATQGDDGNVTDETGTAVDWVLAAREVGERYGIGRSMEEHINDVLTDDGDSMTSAEISMKAVFNSLRARLSEAYDDQGELMSAGAIFSEIAEEAGYDGVIMDAGLHFGPRKGFGGVAIKGMKGVKTNTLHMVPFSATQVKSATGNSGAFDPENPDIRYSRRAAYGVDQPDVLIGSPLGAAQNHPDYAAAKSGDVPAAMRLSAALVNQELIAKIKDLIGDAKPVVVPVVAIEASGRNKIPRAAAEVLAAKLGLKAATSIGQRNSPKRTGMDGVDRLFASPVFDGDVVAGQDYLLLDDTITQGGTFAALASHIQAAGGRVLGSVALTGKQYSATLKPSAASLQKLRDKFSDIEPEFQAITGYGFDALTESEARYIANYKPADTLRVRILAEGRRAGRSADTPTLGAISKSYRPEASRFDDTVYKLQNKMIDTKRVIESITAAVGQIADDLNVYLQEELFHGRAAKRVADFGKEELKPLMEQIGRDGYTIADVEEYLQARHAPEANQVIAQRNPNDPGLQDGGSGMANAAAAAYMASLSATDAQKLAGIAAQVDAIIRQTRQLYVSYSLESQDTVDAWEQMFQNYIPLQREDKEGRMGIGQGFSVKGKETKGRTGSTRKVVDVLANIALQREKLIVRGEKNRVATALVGLALANPDPDLWSVGPPPSTRVYDPKTNTVVDRVDPMYKSRDEVLVAKIADANGVIKEVAVVFNQEDPRALRMVTALKNLDAANLEGLLGVSAKITRYFSAVNTQYNPVFGVVNLVRDVQGAMINLGETPLAGQRLEIARNTMSALAGIYADMRAERNGTVGASPWAQLFEEFELEGGQTGFRDLFKTSADRAEALQKILTPDAWMNSRLGKIFTANGKLKVPMSEARKGAGWIFDWLSDYNGAMENAVRLSAYKAGIDQGMSKQQAASLAKNLTVNFNRKGQAGQHAGALYAFFNAAMQGTARLGQTLFTMQPGKPKTIRLSSTGKKVVYGGILLGVTQAMLLAAAGFGDDDPPEFLRERALIIPVGGKNYVSIPMPLGFHVIPGIGRHAAEFALSGFEKPQKRIVAMVGMFMDAFNPIGNAGLSMQTVMPTALDPLSALLENKDWTGKPIARTSSNPAIPGHTQFKDTATAPAKWLAEAINWVTGGNEYVAGVISPTPDQIDYLFGQVTGGVGRELSKVEQTAKAVVTGEELPTFKVPLAGRFFGNADSQASQASAFYDNVNKLNELETEVKGMRKDGKAAEAAALIRSRPDAYLIARANVAERQVQRLRREKRELLKKGAERSVIKAKEAQITETMKRLNAAMAQ